MIARILYRESVHGVLNYVFEKEKGKILGFGNTYSETHTDPKQFAQILYHLGQRSASSKRYSHITLNLPHGEKLNDKAFYELAKKYMNHMEYGSQPYVVVRHFDTKHQHVHIVSTTVKEEGDSVNLSNDYRRNVATQRTLEQEFGLSPSPETKTTPKLPLYRLPEIDKDDSNGVKFYIQDILNNTLQKFKVRSFEELADLVASHHILVKPITNYKGRIGVSYGIAINNGYKSRFIDGYIVHPRLSGPKLKAVFERQAQSKLLPMHRKRLEKQMLTTFKLFKSVDPNELESILSEYQKVDCKLNYHKNGAPVDFTIYDKSGYVFRNWEINSDFGLDKNSVLRNGMETSRTQLDLRSHQLELELQKLIKNACYKLYLDSYKQNLLSQFVQKIDLKRVMPTIESSDSFSFLSRYMYGREGLLIKMIQSKFKPTIEALYLSELKKENTALSQKAELIKEVIGKGIFDLKTDTTVLFDLLQSLGVKYGNGQLSYFNSNECRVPLALGRIRLPETMNSYISTGFVNQNEKILQVLAGTTDFKDANIGGTALFLPLIFPRLYNVLTAVNREKYDMLSLATYQKIAEQMQIPFEKSATDYIKLFNAKGFYFERSQGKLQLHSIYSKSSVGIPLKQKTERYLLSALGLEDVLKSQYPILDGMKSKGQDNLKNLWVSHLIEKQLYDKAAFMMVNDDVRPNLDLRVLKFHMENGLKEKIVVLAKQRINAKHAEFLRKSVYAFSALLGKTNYSEEEVFNGFRDELTDYGRYRSAFQ